MLKELTYGLLLIIMLVGGFFLGVQAVTLSVDNACSQSGTWQHAGHFGALGGKITCKVV